MLPREHEQFVGSFQVFGQPVDDGLEVEGRLAGPVREHSAVQIKTRTRQDLVWRYNGRWSAYFLTHCPAGDLAKPNPPKGGTWAMVVSVRPAEVSAPQSAPLAHPAISVFDDPAHQPKEPPM